MRSLPAHFSRLPVSKTTIASEVAQGITESNYTISVGDATPPDTLDSDYHPAFSLNDTDRINRPTWVSELSDASIISGRYVVTRDGGLVIDTIEGGQRKRLITEIIKRKAPKTLLHTRRVKEPVSMIGSRWTGYFHWMTDALPRLALIQKRFDLSSDIAFFIFPTGVPAAGIEALQGLGVKKSQLLPVKPNERLMLDRLILPSLPGKTGRPPKWALSFLRKNLLVENKTSDKKYSRRLYLARKSTRTIENRDEILPYLRRNGFQAVYPERYSFFEQVSLFSNAEAVVGPHGSGFTNTIFCNPGTKLLELFSSRYVNPCYFHIARNLDLDYCYATDDSPAYPDYRSGNPYNKNHMIIELEKIKTWVQEL